MSETNNPYAAPASLANDGPAGGMLQCKGCGNGVHSSAAICPHCGASQRSRGYRNKYIAALLALLLGGFGVHRFYLGQWWGIFYLLFFWLGIPGLIAFIEMIVFLASDQVKWDIKYNEGKPDTGGSGGSPAIIAVVVIVVLFFGVAVLGILAAIAIPAYHDYTLRARANEGLVAAHEVKLLVEDYAIENNIFPDDNADVQYAMPAELKSVESITISEGGEITVEYRDASDALNGQTILFSPYVEDDRIEWDCTGGTLENRFRPMMCR